MNSKMVNIALILTVIGLLGLVFYVKKDSEQQAKDYVKKTIDVVEKKLKSDKELRINNNLMWELVLEIKDGGTDRKDVISTIKNFTQKYKDQVAFDLTAIKGQTHWSFGWAKTKIQIIFDEKGKLQELNLDALLSKE